MSANILLVDDEPGIRSGASEILALEGYSVDSADCGRSALELIENKTYDVVLMDYRLPDVDGLTLLQAVRNKLPDIMTCMITAYANIETAVFATRQGVDIFLPKPFSPDDLVGTVKSLLEYKQLRVEAARLRAEHAASLVELASEKSQTHSLVANLRDGVMVVNREGMIALTNSAMEKILGVQPDGLLGKNVSVALANEILAPARGAFDPDNPAPVVFEADVENGRLFVKVNGFYDGGGNRLGNIITIVDISMVRRLALEKARFTRTLVHELRAPLGALKSIIEVLQDRSLGYTLESYDNSLTRANERIDGLSELISDLLSLAHIEHEGADHEPATPLSVAPVINEVMELWKDRAASAAIGLEADLAENLPLCAIHLDDLRTVLTNLIGNAIKYNRPKGRVFVGAKRSAEGLEIAVRDTGIGIDPKNIDRLGDEFFREKKKETRQIEGNGLGLAIVKRLLHRAGGQLQMSSVPGEGSEFRAVFPC
jgi:two-component system phosphate regulon sensor histidine kinase PhoR